MKQDILDKLELKNSENLSEIKSRKGELTHLNTELQSQKINDDFSNLEQIIDKGEMIPIPNKVKFNNSNYM